MRVFIAIPMSPELRNVLASLQEKFSPIGKLKLVEKENFHLTLKFLDEISEEKKDQVIETLSEKIKTGSFSIGLHSVGVFPSPNYVRVIWVGVKKGDENVHNLQKTIDEILFPIGFEKDGRFHSHFTLSRVKWIDKEKLKELLKQYQDKSFGEFSVESIDVMKSELKQRGPTYSLLKRIRI